MNFSRAATRPLWPTLLLCLTLIGGGSGAAYWGWLQSEAARHELEQQATRLLQHQSRVHRLQTDGKVLEQAWERLQALKAQDFFAPGNRLEWVEILRQNQTRLALPGIQYEFQPRRPLEQGNDQFMVTPLQLQLSLNHELELEAFLQSLVAQKQVLILPRECDFSPDTNRPSPPQPGPNIKVSCRLDWITGHLPEKSQP